jgi:6-phospho-beta-glucosidase
MIKKAKMDFLAHSYYQSLTVEGGTLDSKNPLAAMIGANIVKNPYLKTNEWGWAIDPLGMRICVKEIYERYRLPIFTVECGIGADEKLNAENTVEDDYRIEYFREHIEQLKQAVSQDGVDLMGFLTWGPIDLLSSRGEMRKRYGFVFVNRTDTEIRDLKRYKKKSYDWFRRVTASNGGEL